jgi:type II secretory pathway component GspD/PulD (secretin)
MSQLEGMLGGGRQRGGDSDGGGDGDSDNRRSAFGPGMQLGGATGSANQQPEPPRVEGIKRQTTPPRQADPRDLGVKLEEGKVPPFNFVGQPWPNILQWLANLYGYSLDWQEMPADYLNLTTQRAHTVDEVRNLINRHLVARGFTLVIKNDVLSVFRISDVDPSLVPRVAEEDLYELLPYDFVRVTFMAPAHMKVETAPEDVKKLLSPYARVLPLIATRRLVVMDVAENLRSVSQLINEEMTVSGVPREFVLKYARADKVIETLYVILGINPDQQPQQQDVRIERRRWEVIQDLASEGGDVQGFMQQAQPKVFLAHNARRNSVLANAPPDQMRVIAMAVDYLDVPQGGNGGLEDISLAMGAPAPDGTEYLEKYQLITMDPDKMLVTLKEVGDLSPWAELRSDAASKTLFIKASAEDHQKIGRLINQLDGVGRRFQVLQLRRLPADAVATTIQQLMVGQDDSPISQLAQAFRGNRGGGNRGGGNRGNRGGRNQQGQQQQQQQTLDPTKGFRVTADIENNRLLLWANERELVEVKNLLAQLGEITDGLSRQSYVVVDVDPKSVEQLMNQLRRAWVGDNPVFINGQPAGGAAQPQQAPAPQPNSTQPPRDRGAAAGESAGMVLASLQERPLPVVSAVLTRPEGEAAQVPSQFVHAEQSPSEAKSQAEEPTAAAVQRILRAAGRPAAAPSTPATGGTPATTPAPVTLPAAAPGATSAPAAASAAAGTAPNDFAANPAMPGMAPVNVTMTPDGQIIISSTDDAAREQMEQLVRQMAPQPPRFRVFPIKHVTASNVWLNLTEYYADEINGDQSLPPWLQVQTNRRGGLSARQNLSILYDTSTNSVIVSGASAAQLEEIEQLIGVFDRPTSAEAVSNRRTQVIPLKYSTASVIATAVKDVYRELLSSRDRDLQGGGRGQGGMASAITRDTVILYGSGENGISTKKTEALKLGFDSAISIGVDEAANAVVVSAQEELFDTVVDLVRELDRQAAPSDEDIIAVPVTGLDVIALSNALNGALGANISQPQTTTQQNNQFGQRGQGGQRGGQFQQGGGRGGQFGTGGGTGARGGQARGQGGQGRGGQLGTGGGGTGGRGQGAARGQGGRGTGGGGGGGGGGRGGRGGGF